MKINELNITIIILLLISLNGCVQSYSLGKIDAVDNYTDEFFITNEYKLNLGITKSEEKSEYLYSMKYQKKDDNIKSQNVKASIRINKYGTPNKYKYVQKIPVDNFEPKYDSVANVFNYKYKFKGIGKYEMSIIISEIGEIPLEKDIHITFVQTIK